MPIYEYKCTSCGNQLEIMQKISDEPINECPRCNQPKLEKQWSLSGFQFKGSGWYITDYTNRGKENKPETKTEKAANGNSGESAKTSSSSESTASAPTASKSETKSAKTD